MKAGERNDPSAISEAIIYEEQNSQEGENRPSSIMPPKGFANNEANNQIGIAGVKRRIQVTLEEKTGGGNTQSAMTSERSMHLSPTDVFARTRQIIEKINTTRQEISQSEHSNKEFPQSRVLNVQKKNLIKKNPTEQQRAALQVGASSRNHHAETMNIRSKSLKFLNKTES